MKYLEKSIGYLGVMLDHSLTWKEHVAHVSRKLSNGCCSGGSKRDLGWPWTPQIFAWSRVFFLISSLRSFG